MCVCVSVCVKERGEEEREWVKGREREGGKEFVFMRENKWKGEIERLRERVCLCVWERKKDEPGPSYEGSS